MQAAKEAGVLVSDALADAYMADRPQYQAIARLYLREHILFDLTDRMLQGLQTYYREAAAVGLIASPVEPRFFASAALATTDR
jgi:hypothetical protein